MAETRLSDIYDAVPYNDLTPVNSPEKTAFFESGVAVRTQLLDNLANGEGKIAELPFWNDLDANIEPNYSSDDPGVTATPQKVAQGEQIARKAFMNQGYSEMDLANELAVGGNALQQVRNRFGTYWMRRWQRRLLSGAIGVHADNVANDSGDMVHDIANEDGDNALAANLWSQAAFVEAAYTMGDMVDGISSIAVHSAVAKQITNQNGAEDVRDSEGNLLYQSYLGRRIIVDDQMPVVAGATSGNKYLSILFGPGAFGYGEGTPAMPSEIDRAPRSGNGGGQEELWERKTWLLHPAGFQQTGTPAGDSFTNAELEAATSWDRVVERKLVPMAFLWTN